MCTRMPSAQAVRHLGAARCCVMIRLQLELDCCHVEQQSGSDFVGLVIKRTLQLCTRGACWR